MPEVRFYPYNAETKENTKVKPSSTQGNLKIFSGECEGVSPEFRLWHYQEPNRVL